MRLMRTLLLLITLIIGVPPGTSAQVPACQQVLTTLTVPAASYVQADAAPFGGRVFLYVPAITAGRPAGFEPFKLWVVEGIYGQPFIQPSGRLDAASFEKLRGTANIRATPISVTRGNTNAGTFRIAREMFQAQVLEVNVPNGSVRARICR
jgi:hypothetical protein